MTTQPQDQEDPQSGEILPPMLLEDWYADRIGRGGIITSDQATDDALVKYGMQRACELFRPYLKAALPYYEAGVRDTRIEQADASVVRALAEYKELLG